MSRETWGEAKKKVVAFYSQFRADNNRSPTLQEIAEGTDLKKQTVFPHFKKLKAEEGREEELSALSTKSIPKVLYDIWNAAVAEAAKTELRAVLAITFKKVLEQLDPTMSDEKSEEHRRKPNLSDSETESAVAETRKIEERRAKTQERECELSEARAQIAELSKQLADANARAHRAEERSDHHVKLLREEISAGVARADAAVERAEAASQVAEAAARIREEAAEKAATETAKTVAGFAKDLKEAYARNERLLMEKKALQTEIARLKGELEEIANREEPLLRPNRGVRLRKNHRPPPDRRK